MVPEPNDYFDVIIPTKYTFAVRNFYDFYFLNDIFGFGNPVKSIWISQSLYLIIHFLHTFLVVYSIFRLLTRLTLCLGDTLVLHLYIENNGAPPETAIWSFISVNCYFLNIKEMTIF